MCRSYVFDPRERDWRLCRLEGQPFCGRHLVVHVLTPPSAMEPAALNPGLVEGDIVDLLECVVSEADAAMTRAARERVDAAEAPWTNEVYWRVTKNGTVACLQSFDEPDYAPDRWATSTLFATEEGAQRWAESWATARAANAALASERARRRAGLAIPGWTESFAEPPAL